MLIVAMPLAASSALLSMLEAATDIIGKQQVYCEPKKRFVEALGAAEVFFALPHSDNVNFSTKWMNRFLHDRIWYSQHVPPTNKNRMAIEKSGAPWVLLTRDVRDVVVEYDKRGIRGEDVQIQLDLWFTLWHACGSVHMLNVTYDEVVDDHMDAIHRICKHFGVRVRRQVPLANVGMCS